MKMTLVCNEPNNRFCVAWEGTQPTVGSLLLFRISDVLRGVGEDDFAGIRGWRVTKVVRVLKPTSFYQDVILAETEVAVHVERSE